MSLAEKSASVAGSEFGVWRPKSLLLCSRRSSGERAAGDASTCGTRSIMVGSNSSSIEEKEECMTASEL